MKQIGYRFILLSVSLFLLTAFSGCNTNNIELPPGWQVIRPPETVLSIVLQDDIVWAGCKDGVYKIDRNTGTVVEKLEIDRPLTYVKALLVDRSGNLVIGHFNGLTIYNGSSYHTYTDNDLLPDNRINALMEDTGGRLWAGTWGGAVMIEGDRSTTTTSADGLADDMVNVILQDDRGDMWFGSYTAPRGGVSLYRNRTWQIFSTENGLPHNNVTSLLQDNGGNIWAGTGLIERGGAVKFVNVGDSWKIDRTLDSEDGLAGNKVRSIFQDVDGVFWFGSEYDGLARWDGKEWTILTTADGLSSNEIMCMLQDQDGTLWMGTADGITRISRQALLALP